jgi:hypothetical protein
MEPRRTFADLYCEQHGLPRPQYHAAVFRRALFPHARLTGWIVRIFQRLHFLPDHEFVEDVGHITCVADFAYPLGSFIEHPANRGKLRRVLGLRVSARRLLRIVRETFADPSGPAGRRIERGTFGPFDPSAPGG